MRLFEDVVAGTPTAEAFRAPSVYLRNAGSTPGTVAWFLPSDADLTGEGVFAPSDPGREEAYANLYTVLWFFERAEEAAVISGELDQWSVRCDGERGKGLAAHRGCSIAAAGKS